MTSKQLGTVLSDMYNNAPKNEQVSMVYVFGIKFHDEIRRYGVKDVFQQSGITSTGYYRELSKAVSLAKYVNLKPEYETPYHV